MSGLSHSDRYVQNRRLVGAKMSERKRYSPPISPKKGCSLCKFLGLRALLLNCRSHEQVPRTVSQSSFVFPRQSASRNSDSEGKRGEGQARARRSSTVTAEQRNVRHKRSEWPPCFSSEPQLRRYSRVLRGTVRGCGRFDSCRERVRSRAATSYSTAYSVER